MNGYNHLAYTSNQEEKNLSMIYQPGRNAHKKV